jgi:uncharacterized protein (TIGR01777 family)
MQVAITGSSGLIGTALTSALRSAGHRVRPIVRRAPSDPDEIGMDALDLAGVDAVVNLAGAGIADERWDEERKRLLVSSRVDTTTTVAAAVVRDGVPVLLSCSAIGYYGNRGDDVLTEESAPGDDYLAGLCVAWEGAAEAAVEGGVRVAYLRTGIVLSPRGGALKKLLPLFKLGVGGRMGSGKQWVSWIAIDDHVAATIHLLTAAVAGPVNLTAPNPVTNAEQAKTLGRVLHRPAVLPTPSFGPKLVLGSELASALLHDSQRVLPTVLLADGFSFAHPDLEGALRALLAE